MASPTLSPLPGTHDPEMIPIPFRATLDAGNDAVLVEGKRGIASIAHTGTGTYTLTLKEGYRALAAALMKLYCPTVVAMDVQVNSDTATTAAGGTVLLTIVKPSDTTHSDFIATDPPAANNNATELHGVLWVRNLSVT